MPRKYLGSRDPIPEEVLRQRRDLYALAIGLSIFNLAGGVLVSATTLGSFLPVRLAHPEFLLYAAWVGFLYFWWRFWQVCDARPIADFLEEVQLQAGDSRAIRRLARRHVVGFHNSPIENQEQAVDARAGVIPKVNLTRFELGLTELGNRRWRTDKRFQRQTIGPDAVAIEGADRWTYAKAVLLGIPKALWFERSFADYTAPHLLAVCAVGLGIWRLLSPASIPPTHPPMTVAPTTRAATTSNKPPPAYSCELRQSLRQVYGAKEPEWVSGYGGYYACVPSGELRKR